MPLPLIVPVLAGGAALAGLIAYFASKTPPVLPAAASEDLAGKVANRGPKGEYVFKPELAEALVRSLASQRYGYPDETTRSLVEIKPEATGAPLSPDVSALGWARSLNSSMTILAPLYLAVASPAKRFLRAVPAGQETDFAGGPGTVMYAVLLYAGALDSNLAPPGKPPSGGAVTPLTQILPGTPEQQKAAAELPQELQMIALDALSNSRDPDALDKLADEIEKDGFVDFAKQLRKRSAELRLGQSATTVPGVQGQTMYVTAKAGLNFRSGPGATYASLGTVPYGVQAIALETRSTPTAQAPMGWTHVQIRERDGWLSAEWLSQSPPGEAVPGPQPGAPSTTPTLSPEGTAATNVVSQMDAALQSLLKPALSTASSPIPTGVVTAASGLNMRSAPSTTATILIGMPKGSQVTVLGSSSNWYNVTYGGKIGWASKDYISVNPATQNV